MTPREFYREQEAAKEQWQYEAEQRLVQAWYVAALSRTETLPKLDVLLKSRPRRQTPTEQRAVLYQLSQQYGIPLRES